MIYRFSKDEIDLIVTKHIEWCENPKKGAMFAVVRPLKYLVMFHHMAVGKVHTIPNMTHELGKSWEQPNKDDILIVDDIAYIHYEEWDLLCEYNTSTPTGVYEGKMWKTNLPKGQKWLRWYVNKDEQNCEIISKKVFLL